MFNRNSVLLVVALVFAACFSNRGEARPLPSMERRPAIDQVTAGDLVGMVNLGNCSGGFVDLGREPSAPAVVITNGHCVTPEVKADEALVDVPFRRTLRIGTPNGWFSVQATRILYATLTGTDLALLELEQTHQQVLDSGAEPFTIAAVRPSIGTRVRVTSGYWRETLRCGLDRVVHKIVEGFSDGSAPSIATDAYAFSAECRAMRGGFSGTPVVVEGSREVVALAFTSYTGGRACTLNNPCEESQVGERRVVAGGRYSSRVDDVPSCLSGGQLDLDLLTCSLFRPTKLLK